MTENKRFVYYEHKGADYILENPNTDLDFIEMLGDCLDEKEIVNRLNGLYEENEQLKQENNKLQGKYDHLLWLYNGLGCDYDGLKDENMELKQRNDRQAKQLDRLYSLIEEKDWTALSDIIDDFKRCEEQLQKEWGVYDESE